MTIRSSRTWRRVGLALLPAVALCVVVGSWVRSSRLSRSVPAPPAGRSAPPRLWHPVKDGGAATRTTVPESAVDALAALPYLQGYKSAPAQTGVTVHEREHAFQGVNLVVSGHGPEAFLMDMDGTRLHTWRLGVERVWADADAAAEGAQYWRRAHAFENGDLLAIFDGLGLVKLNRESRPLWSFRANCHHDLFVQRDGTVWC